MSRSRRIKKLADLARHKEKMAGFELRRLRRSLQEQDEQLDQLNGFRSEYCSKLQASAREGMDAGLIRNYHLFFRGLNEAIEAQDANVCSVHAHLEAGEAHWRHEYRKAGSLDKAVDRMDLLEKKAEEQRSDRRVEEDVNARRGQD